MTVTMSSEGESAKCALPESKEKSATDNTDSSQDSQDAKVAKQENDVKLDEKNANDETPKASQQNDSNENDKKPDEDVKKEDKETKVNNTDETDAKDGKENDKDVKDEQKSEASEKDEEEEESEKDDQKKVPLLDEPLEKSGKRERKNVQRFNDEFRSEQKTETKIEIENGNGTPLGDIPRVDASISRFKNDDLKLLHRVLFKVPGKTTIIKKNIRKFNGFEFKKDSDEYSKKIATIQRLELKQLKSVCEMLDLQKSGNKDEITERIMDFLLEPKDSGKPVGGGRPKRTAAVRANNRGYSSHDDYSSDDRQTSRARRDKGRRSNLKDESSSESDKDFQPSDGSDERPRVNKRKRGGRKKASSDEEEISDVSAASSDESDDEPKNKRRKNAKINNKTKAKTTPGRRGRKPGSGQASKMRGRKKDETSEEEDEESDHKDEEGSSSEDEPLAKKTKSAQPPTDDEIKEYVKKILEGANLEEITMKTVCQRVYAHYPNFDLAHKKDFIKSTVKSLIST